MLKYQIIGDPMKLKILCFAVFVCLLSGSFGNDLLPPSNNNAESDSQENSNMNAQLIVIEPYQWSKPHLEEDLSFNPRMVHPAKKTDELKDLNSGNNNIWPHGKNKRPNMESSNSEHEGYITFYSPFIYEFPYLANLSMDLENAEYFETISLVFNLTDDLKSKLITNGFVVVNHTMINGYSLPITSFLDAYETYWHQDLPIFITTDTILNIFHLLFDTMLKDIEKESLVNKVKLMSQLLMNDSIALFNSLPDGILKNISRETSVFFAVATCLMDNSTILPASIQEDVSYYIGKIMDATEIVFEYTYDGKRFYTDYSQYKPRGHYAGDELLERYFRSMMWYGRKSLDLSLANDTRVAVIITELLDNNVEAKQLWYDVYNITKFLVGASDSISFIDIKAAVMNSTGELTIDMLNCDVNVQMIMDELQKSDYISQRILSTIVGKSYSQAFEQMDFPKIFQFMGQRYVPDSEVIQNVIYDRVPLYEDRRRGLANGLDIMASLGSFRAVEHLESELAYYNYSANLEYSYNIMNCMSDEFWNETTYNGWLSSYSTLVSNKENCSQLFMRTEAWADEKLNSVLGSWAELRHDTILYAKQSYSIRIECSTPDAWAEPYPIFYRKISELCNRTTSILTENLPDSSVTPRFVKVFSDFERININLSAISEKELKNEDLTQEEKNFLKSIFSLKFVGCGEKEEHGWLPQLLDEAGVEEDTQDTRIIADVNTDPGSIIPPMPPKVLHVGVGYVETLIVLYQKPDGNFTFAVGPVYSYYEFPLQGFTRLTDDEWKDQVKSGTQKRPFWARSFFVNEEICMVSEYE